MDIRARVRDGKEQLQLKCPNCKKWGDIDKEQLEGKVSCVCPECGAHFFVDPDGGIDLNMRVD